MEVLVSVHVSLLRRRRHPWKNPEPPIYTSASWLRVIDSPGSFRSRSAHPNETIKRLAADSSPLRRDRRSPWCSEPSGGGRRRGTKCRYI